MEESQALRAVEISAFQRRCGEPIEPVRGTTGRVPSGTEIRDLGKKEGKQGKSASVKVPEFRPCECSASRHRWASPAAQERGQVLPRRREMKRATK